MLKSFQGDHISVARSDLGVMIQVTRDRSLLLTGDEWIELAEIVMAINAVADWHG